MIVIKLSSNKKTLVVRNFSQRLLNKEFWKQNQKPAL